jgi:hypothetical protein
MRNLIASSLCVAALVACAPAQSNSGTGSTATSGATVDTLTGVVTEVGADPATWMSIRPASGEQSLRIVGPFAPIMRSVSGTEVWVSGRRQVDGFSVDAFEVRRANGVAVDDGMVVVDGGKAYLRASSGSRREITDPPRELLGMNGARVWITRAVPGQTPTYGVIARP